MMNNWLVKKFLNWKSVVLTVVFAYAILVFFLAINPAVKMGRHGANIPLLKQRHKILKTLSNPLEKDRLCIPLSGLGRSLDMQLPSDARVYLPGMLGRDNAPKLGYYYFISYYLFPRDVHVSLNDDIEFVGTGYWSNGVAAASDADLVKHGYHMSVVFSDKEGVSTKQHLPLARRNPETVQVAGVWDPLFAFLLPLVAAVSGGWLLALMFPGFRKEMGPGENFAGGLAVGCILIAFLVLALRLIGLRLERTIFCIMLLASVGRVGWYLKCNPIDRLAVAKKILRWEYLLLLPFVVLFYYLASLAGGLESILEYDAIGAWVLKAKILHFATGADIFKWFSTVRLSHAHLEYPLMVSTLHAMTFGVVGRANDFVLKFWSVWMLFAYVTGVLSAFRWPARNKFLAVAAVLMVAFLPRTIQFVRMEGAVIPMMFFVSMGSLECMLGLHKGNRDRFLFGLMFLFCAARTKPDGFIFILFWVAAALLIASGRQMLKPDRRLVILFVLCIVAVMPFKYLRSQVPVLHPQAHWAKDAKESPKLVAARAPKIAAVIIARSFIDDNLANWTAGDGNDLDWTGRWTGMQSMIQKYNWGYAWLNMFLGVMILVFARGRRYSAFVVMGVFFGYQVLLGLVFCSLGHSIVDLQSAIGMSEASTGGRYVFPIVTATGLCLLALLSCDDKLVKDEAEK